MVNGKAPKTEPLKRSKPELETFVGRVFINEIGKSTLLNEARPIYPDGTIIVREKLGRESPQAELLAVMIKRHRGFDPLTGDWEYQVFDGPGTTRKPEVKAEACVECHQQQQKNDYVFRSYVSASHLLKER
jgi:hypothetical protein